MEGLLRAVKAAGGVGALERVRGGLLTEKLQIVSSRCASDTPASGMHHQSGLL